MHSTAFEEPYIHYVDDSDVGDVGSAGHSMMIDRLFFFGGAGSPSKTNDSTSCIWGCHVRFGFVEDSPS